MLKSMRSQVAVLCLLAGVTVPAITAAQSNTDFPDLFWKEWMMKAMDRNNDGMVTREEFLTYMGEQFDRMDMNKDKRLSAQEFTNKQMMSSTFPSSVSETGATR